MANGTVTSRLYRPVDVHERSATFARLACRARRRLKLELGYLAELTRIDVKRLQTLETGREVFRCSELQLLGVILGIGLDRLFPLPRSLSAADIHGIFLSLLGQDIGLIAGTPGETVGDFEIDQAAFERSVVQLHYCAECLAKFPS